MDAFQYFTTATITSTIDAKDIEVELPEDNEGTGGSNPSCIIS